MHKKYRIRIEGIESHSCFGAVLQLAQTYFSWLLFLVLLLFNISLRAQSGLWGLTNGGGEGGGTLFKTDGTGKNDTVKYNFPQTAGGTKPHGGLITASNGKIYGTTQYGGYYGDATSGGTLFEFDPNNLSLAIKVHFGNPYLSTGTLPLGGLSEANGKLYGMTSAGGIWSSGTIFEYDLTTGIHTVLWSFRAYNDPLGIGSNPVGSLLPASNGKLYGVAAPPGFAFNTYFFEFDLATLTINPIFQHTPGASQDFIQLNDGKIYGLTTDYNTGHGEAFSYDPVNSTLTFRHEFFGGFCCIYTEKFTLGPKGKLYTNMNYEVTTNTLTIGEFDPLTNSYVNVFDFGTTDVAQALQPILLGKDSILYGTSSGGGANGKGVLYSFNTYTQTYTQLHDFAGLEGAEPWGFMTQAPNGKIYGTTYSGGKEDKGALFQYDPVTNVYTKVYDFIIEPQSTSPQSSLLFLADTIAYGSTMKGGKYLNGTVFSYVPHTDTFTNLFNFDSTTTGGDPTGSLIQASNGVLYGMTSAGGSSGQGILYAFTPSGNNFAKRYDFSTLAGANPLGALLQAPDGLLYGLASQGGSSDNGVLFSFDFNATTSGYTKKIDLDGAALGGNPKGSLVTAPGLNRKLYGMTENGGSNGLGIIFSYDYTSNTFINVHDFTASDGTHPDGSLVLAKDNLFYGMTSSGGANGQGTLFSFNPATNAFTKNQDLSTITGANPQGSLWQASNGKLYGMTKKGGDYNLGTVFEYDYTTNILTKTVDFNWDNGASPVYGNLVEVCLIPKISMQPQNIITCLGSAFQLNLTATGVRSYQWFANNASVTGANQSVLTIGGATSFKTYYCRIANECGTITSHVVTVTGNPLPTIAGTVFPSFICTNTPVTLTGSGAPLITVSGGITSGIGFIPTVSGIKVYTITGIAANQCTNTALLTLTVNSLPNVTVTGNTSNCSGFFTTLTAGGANTYSWSTGSIDSTITISPPSTTAYQVTGTGFNGCSSIATTTVTVKSLPNLTISGKTEICVGSATILSAKGASTYSWSTNATTTSINVSPVTTTTYTITGTGTNGCQAIQAITLTVNQLPMVSLDLSGINNICDTLSPITLTGGSPTPGNYWYNNSTITSVNTSKAATYPIQYRYTNANGCVNTASGILTSIHCTVPGICERPNAPCYCTNTCPPPFKVYTGITPNNDGKNDTWLIDSLATENTVTVLDKWGNEVYQKEHYNNDWDGKQDGKELPSGVYYYLVDNDRKRFSGTVSIIR